MVAEAMDQDLSLIEPRCMNRGKARTPPSVGVGEVVLRIARGVTGIALLNQKDAFQAVVALAKTLQSLAIMHSIFFLHAHRFHLTRVYDQEDQDIDGPMARVSKSLLLDRTGNNAPVEIDGGIDRRNIGRVVAAGARIIVAGSAVFHTGDPERATRDLKAAAMSALSALK